MDKLEQEYQRKTTIQSLVQSAGMRLFKTDLSDCVAYSDAELDGDKKGYIPDTKLAKLNFDLGRKAGLEMVLMLLQNYEDEIVGDDVNLPKK